MSPSGLSFDYKMLTGIHVHAHTHTHTTCTVHVMNMSLYIIHWKFHHNSLEQHCTYSILYSTCMQFYICIPPAALSADCNWLELLKLLYNIDRTCSIRSIVMTKMLPMCAIWVFPFTLQCSMCACDYKWNKLAYTKKHLRRQMFNDSHSLSLKGQWTWGSVHH